MSRSCFYRDCNYVFNKYDDSVTLFRFPKEDKRQLEWLKECGYSEQEISRLDLHEARFLCDKHFSKNYIAKQSRRKMLVQTAVPITYIPPEQNQEQPIQDQTILNSTQTSNIDANTIIINMDELSDKQLIETLEGPFVEPPPVKKNPVKKPLPKKVFYKAKYLNNSGSSVDSSVAASSSSTKLQDPKQEGKIMVVLKNEFNKMKRKSAFGDVNSVKALKIKHVINGKDSVEKIVTSSDEIMEIIENVTNSPEKFTFNELKNDKSPPKSVDSTKPAEMSEFIFNGEMYVQMPKRVFDEEKQKLQEEVEKYKNLLRSIRSQLSNID